MYELIPILALSITILTIMYFRYGFRDPLFLIVFFYFYFTFGPVFNILLGNEVYFGIVKNKIHQSTFIFLISMFTVLVVSFVVKPKLYIASKVIKNIVTFYPTLRIGLFLLILYTSYHLLIHAPYIMSMSKNARIEHVGPKLHYNYLLIQLYITSSIFLLKKKDRNGKKLFTANFVLYVIYCLLYFERDFIFPLISIIIHSNLGKSETRSLNRGIFIILSLFLLTSVSTFIFVLRMKTYSPLLFSTLLNQGSLLFINTQIMSWIDSGQPFMYGYTYLNTVLNLLPSWIYHTDFNVLNWFKDTYAPGGESGYGFALDAEAYLNFGYLGIVFVFFIIALVQRLTFNMIGRHSFFLYFSVFYTAFLMYCLRGDSLAYLKGNLYAILFFFLNHLLSKVFRLGREPRSLFRIPVRSKT